ncbi:MAG: HAD family hydrolase, partial [Chroococcidiopsis sp.]
MIVNSFDIFDTVLVRNWARPTHLFWELGLQLRQAQLIEVLPETWQEMREVAEKTARTKTATGEITLYQIYEELMPACNWSVSDVETAMQYEIELERLSLVAVPVNQQKIQELHKQHQSIIFISDMYLPSEIIKGFLKEHEIWAEGDRIYVSGEVGEHKASGKLFQYYLAQHQLVASQLFHTGDNLYSDFQVPKKLGIAAQAFKETHLNRYELPIADDRLLPLRFRSLLVGASRLTRLHCPESDPHKKTIWNTASNVIAPVFFGFVQWVLVEAKRQGIQRLY